ncbi:MAG TPA: isoaspartyl peptidase/L-asparaginase family protein [Patescibacteria group bacterium]|nr:isoaspartyl peptidase/L-asparaginase family protein [Patescibacteria group bacterium]
MTSHWSIIVHGGAKEIKPEEEEDNRKGVAAALEAGAAILRTGGSAFDAVVAAVCALEDDTTFNAGAGAVKRKDGSVQTDASIMDGDTLNIGAVAAIMDVKNPIKVAQAVFNDDPILLVGEDATAFAKQKKMEPAVSQGESNDGNHDTVGCVARDVNGNIVSGVSTGGLEEAAPGRVGDSALPGCGFYADNKMGGVCMSGEGEDIARTMLAAEVMHRLEQMPVQHAIDYALQRLERIDGEAGGIVLDSDGNPAWAHNSPHFAVAYQTDDMDEPAVFLKKSEETGREERRTDGDGKASMT